MPVITVLVGNPKPASTTRLAAEEVAAQLSARSGAEVSETIDLADVAGSIFDAGDPVVEELVRRVAASDLVVVASPTYKAAYSGLLKAFFDRYGANGLHGVAAVPLLTIGGPQHTLAVETTLRPLLVELGASVPTRGIAFPAGRIDERADIVAEWLDAEWPAIRHAVGVAQPA